MITAKRASNQYINIQETDVLCCPRTVVYKDCLHTQVDGVTLDFPLEQTVANFFLGHLEEKYLQTNQFACLNNI